MTALVTSSERHSCAVSIGVVVDAPAGQGLAQEPARDPAARGSSSSCRDAAWADVSAATGAGRPASRRLARAPAVRRPRRAARGWRAPRLARRRTPAAVVVDEQAAERTGDAGQRERRPARGCPPRAGWRRAPAYRPPNESRSPQHDDPGADDAGERDVVVRVDVAPLAAGCRSVVGGRQEPQSPATALDQRDADASDVPAGRAARATSARATVSTSAALASPTGTEPSRQSPTLDSVDHRAASRACRGSVRADRRQWRRDGCERVASGRGRAAARAARSRFRPVLLLLALGITLSVVAWGYLVYAAIDFGSSARGGDSQAWWFLAIASVGAVACLFFGLMLVARLLRRLGITKPARRGRPGCATARPDEPEPPATDRRAAGCSLATWTSAENAARGGARRPRPSSSPVRRAGSNRPTKSVCCRSAQSTGMSSR